MKNDSRSRTTEDAIRDAVVSLMASIDYDKITADAIAKEAGVARSTFYRYYDSVADLVQSMEQEFIDYFQEVNRLALQCTGDLSEASRPTPSQIARTEHVLRHRDFLLVVDGPHGDKTFRLRAEQIMADYLATRLRSQTSSASEKELYISFMSKGYYGMIRKWIEDYPDMPAVEVAALTNKLLFSIFE